jgi:hypothetical protein
MRILALLAREAMPLHVTLAALVLPQPSAGAALVDPRTYLIKELLELDDSNIVDHCLQQSGGVTSEILRCSSYEYDRKDNIWIDVRHEIQRRHIMSQEEIELSEMLWDIRTSHKCKKEQMFDTGTFGLLIYVDCWHNALAKKIRQFSAKLSR